MRRASLSSCVVGFAFVVSCGGGDLVIPTDGEPAEIILVRGDDQTGRVGERLPEPVVVRVNDAGGRPVPGAPVAFEVDGATADPDMVVTGDDGLAGSTVELGSSVGVAAGVARVVDPGSGEPLEIGFSVTALPASANGMSAASGDNQTAPAGTELPEPLVIEVTDAFGNPVDGVTVEWTAVGGGSVSDQSTITNDEGRASVTRTLGPVAGPQTTVASAEGLAGSPVTFNHTAGSGSAAGIERISGNGQTGRPGEPLADELVVKVTDQDGNPVAGASVTWVVTGGGGTVSPVTSAADGQGLASTAWTLGPDPGANSARAVLSGVGQVEFNATASQQGAPRLDLVTQPSTTAVPGEPFDRQPVVRLRSASGGPIRRQGVRITASIASGNGRLTGQTTRTTDSDGRATFRNLAIADGSGPHTIRFAAPSYLPVTSATIELAGGGSGGPVPGDDAFSTYEGGDYTLTIPAPGVLANDEDPDGDPLTAELVSGPPNGEVRLDPDGGFGYTPKPNFFGDDAFTYRVRDPSGLSATATVRMTVIAKNDPPRFEPGPDQQVPASAGPQTIPGWATRIRAGGDETGQTFQFLVTVVSGAELFSVAPAVSPDGTLSYTPSGIAGTAVVEVVLQDSGGTEHGGKDKSEPHTLVIELTP